jgi:two-component system OmpR family response regulator
MPAKKPEQDLRKIQDPAKIQGLTKILIVEDEGDMSLLLELLLDNEKMVVDHAHNLSDARDFVEKEQPTLILLDNRLPDGLGIDFVSGVDAEAEDAALATGADRFLCKPFTKKQLHESIGKVLN